MVAQQSPKLLVRVQVLAFLPDAGVAQWWSRGLIIPWLSVRVRSPVPINICCVRVVERQTR